MWEAGYLGGSHERHYGEHPERENEFSDKDRRNAEIRETPSEKGVANQQTANSGQRQIWPAPPKEGNRSGSEQWERKAKDELGVINGGDGHPEGHR